MPTFVIDGELISVPNPQPRNKWRRKMKGVTSKKKLKRLRAKSAEHSEDRKREYKMNLMDIEVLRRKEKRQGKKTITDIVSARLQGLSGDRLREMGKAEPQ